MPAGCTAQSPKWTVFLIHLNGFEAEPGWNYIRMPLRYVRNADGVLVRNYPGEIDCVTANVMWSCKYPPPFEFLLGEFYENLA